MSRIDLVNADAVSEESKIILREIKSAFGVVPNMFKAVANSPAALKSMWGSFGALGAGRLGAKLGEQIAVAVADRNACNYCLAAHTALGRKAGATADEMIAAQSGRSSDPRTAAALTFAVAVVEQRGQVAAADIATVKGAGFDDQDIAEIMAHVALNLFTNYVNVALDVPVDFPGVKLTRDAR
jgi:uncharacterized peroxidase-related enzyme